MKYRSLIAVLLLLIITIPSSTLIAEGDMYPKFTLVIVPVGIHEIGSQVNVTAVFIFGNDYVDVDEPYLEIGDTRREMLLHRVDKGLYEALVTLLDEDVEGDHIRISASHNSSIPGPGSSYPGFVQVKERVELPSGKRVEVVLLDETDAIASPGQEVEFQVRVYNENGLVNPYNDTLRVWSTGIMMNTTDYILTSEKSPGVFEGKYTIPADLNRSQRIGLHAEAVIPQYEIDDHYEYHSSYIIVDLMHAHIQVLERNEEAVSVRFFVTDVEGELAQGANVSFTYSSTPPSSSVWSHWLTGMTGPFGTVDFDLEYRFIGPRKYMMHMIGEIKADNITHPFSISLIGKEKMGVITHDPLLKFDIEADYWNFPQDTYVETNITVLYKQEPRANLTVYYYGLNSGEGHFFGTAVTDDHGRISIGFRTPKLPIETYVLPEVTFYIEVLSFWHHRSVPIITEFNSPYSRWILNSDGQCNVSVRDHVVANDFDVVVQSPDADGEMETAWVLWGFGGFHDPAHMYTKDWMRAGYGLDAFGRVECTWSDGAYRATVEVPPFIPSGLDIYVIGLIEFNDVPGVPEYSGYVDGLILERNIPPLLTVERPEDADNASGIIWINGSAWDETTVQEVQISVDGSVWFVVNATDEWSYMMNASNLGEGNHTITVRAFDGEQYSTLSTLEIVVVLPSDDIDQDDGPDDKMWEDVLVIILLILLGITVLLITFIAYMKRS